MLRLELMERSLHLPFLASSFVFFCCFSFFAGHYDFGVLVSAQNSTVPVDVGVILHLRSLPGKRSRTSISMAIEDFYAVHSNYTTRVILHVKDSENEAIGAAAAGNQSPSPVWHH